MFAGFEWTFNNKRQKSLQNKIFKNMFFVNFQLFLLFIKTIEIYRRYAVR